MGTGCFKSVNSSIKNKNQKRAYWPVNQYDLAFYKKCDTTELNNQSLYKIIDVARPN